MVDIKNLRLQYGQQRVLDIPDLRFSPQGFYAIIGPSGCGKTSLVNVIAGIVKEYQGTVIVNGRNVQSLSAMEQLQYRQDTVSLCYQESVLFDDLTSRDNILLKLDFYHYLSKKRREYQVKRLMKTLSIEHLLHKKAKYLSGGEKQRVSIARAVINQAKIMIFDEPTAALDEANAQQVFKLLKSLSTKHLIIVVTHNQQLVSNYADTMIDLSYGTITNVTRLTCDVAQDLDTMPLKLEEGQQPALIKQIGLSWKMFSGRKRRNFVATTIFSFSLTAICTLSVLTTSISEGIQNSFSHHFNQETALIAYKKDQPYPYQAGVTLAQAEMLSNKHKAKLGNIYLNDFKNLFMDTNMVYVQSESVKMHLPSFDANHFNYITFVDEIDIFSTFGYRKTKLLDDEIMLTIPPSDQRIIYDTLKLRKDLTLQRLGEYLLHHQVYITLNVANVSWSYDDEQLWRLVGVRAGAHPQVIHSNPLFSQSLFEDKMALPSTREYTAATEYPWTLRKMYFLFKKENEEILINELSNPKVLLARLNPILLENITNIDINHYLRVTLFAKPQTYMDVGVIPSQADFIDAHLVTNIGLTTYPEALMVGFSDHFLLSVSRTQLEEVISYDERKSVNDNSMIVMGPNMVNGHISLSLGDGLLFRTAQKVTEGRMASSLLDITISSSLYQQLFGTEFATNKDSSLYIATPRVTRIVDNFIHKDYQIIAVHVVSVVQEQKKVIYHQYYWPLLFFKDLVLVPATSIIPTGIITTNQTLINKYQEKPDYRISFPFAQFATTIDQSLSQIISIIYLVAIAALLMTMIVIFLILKTLLDDYNQHFSLLYLFGVNRQTIMNLGLISLSYLLIMSLFTALGSTMIIEVIISRVIFTNAPIFKNLFPYLLTIVISIICVIPSMILMFFKSKNLKLTQLIKKYL